MGLFNYIQSLFTTKGLEHGVSAFMDGQPQYPTDNFIDNSVGGYGKNEVVYACVQEITSSLSEAPIQALDSEGLVVNTDQTVQLLNKPNPYMSGFDFWEITVNHLYLAGNAYWFKVKTRGNKVKELWPLRPDRIRVVPDKDKFIQAYIYQIDGKNHKIAVEDIVHFKFPNPTNEFIGMSPLRPGCRQIATDNDATDFAKVMLQNGGVPGGILKIPEPLSREARQRIRSQWKQAYGGGGRGEIAVLEGDTTYEQISLDMHALAFADLREISESRICMLFGVPPIIIGAKVGLDRATYANYKEARASFWEETISSLQRRLTSRIELDPDLNPRNRDFIFDLSNVPAMADKRQQKFNNAVLGVQSGIITVDEARAEIGLDAMEHEEEEEIQEQMPEEEEEREEEKALRQELEQKNHQLKLLRDSLGTLSAADKFYDRFEHWAKKELKLQGKQFATLVDEFIESQVATKAIDDDIKVTDTNIESLMGKVSELETLWVQHAKDSVAPIMKGVMNQSGMAASATLDIDFDITAAEVLNFVEQQTFKFADSISKTSGETIKTSITQAIENGATLRELKTDLKNKFAGKISEARAANIAQTETIRAANEGSRAAYKSAGVVQMKWIASADACPYCQGLDGKTVSVEENFLNKSDVYQPEGAQRPLNLSYGDIPSPPCHPGCRCTIIPEG